MNVYVTNYAPFILNELPIIQKSFEILPLLIQLKIARHKNDIFKFEFPAQILVVSTFGRQPFAVPDSLWWLMVPSWYALRPVRRDLGYIEVFLPNLSKSVSVVLSDWRISVMVKGKCTRR